jgi:hypothetical protein
MASSWPVRGQFHFRRAAFDTYSYLLSLALALIHNKINLNAFSQQLKGKVGLALAKAAALRINLNLDGAPIARKYLSL